MIAIRQLTRVPKNKRTKKLAQLKEAQYDPIFLADLQEVNDDFAHIDKTEIIDTLSFQLGL